MVVRPVFIVALAAVVIGAVGVVALYEVGNHVRHSANYRSYTELQTRRREAAIRVQVWTSDMSSIAAYVRGDGGVAPSVLHDVQQLQAETVLAPRTTMTDLAGGVPRGDAGRRLRALLIAAVQHEAAWGNRLEEAAAAMTRGDRASTTRAFAAATRALSRCAAEFRAADAVAPQALTHQWSFSVHFG